MKSRVKPNASDILKKTIRVDEQQNDKAARLLKKEIAHYFHVYRYSEVYIVYKIECTVTNKSYIGRTSVPYKRLQKHISDLVSNKHHCSTLQSAWNMYKPKYFEFSFLHCIIGRNGNSYSQQQQKLAELERLELHSIPKYRKYNRKRYK